jgi:hypothetical protein
VYEAIIIWAQAARTAKSTVPIDVSREMRVGRFDLPRGTVELGGSDLNLQQLHLAQARSGQYDVDDSVR